MVCGLTRPPLRPGGGNLFGNEGEAMPLGAVPPGPLRQPCPPRDGKRLALAMFKEPFGLGGKGDNRDKHRLALGAGGDAQCCRRERSLRPFAPQWIGNQRAGGERKKTAHGARPS